jgi:HK97 gp10 family phage protein
MASKISIEQIGEVGKQAKALGSEATTAINGALLKGARIISGEAVLRAPRTRKHRSDHGRGPQHLADRITAQLVSKRKTAGVTVKGGFNGPGYYIKFVEYGTTKQTAQRFIEKSAEAKEQEVLNAVSVELKGRLGL